MGRTLKSSLACHKLLRETAREFAGAFYEGAAHDNTFYKYYPSSVGFISMEWGRFVPHARQTLASMLGRNDISEFAKEEILEALELDRALPGSQQHGLEDPLLAIN